MASLVERLRGHFIYEDGWQEHKVPRNPDGPEAADRITALEAMCETLAGYAVHKRECPIVKGWGQAGNCQCGLSEALTQYRAMKEKNDG